ncbi:MAG: hypothetical protein LBQ14_01030 [Treponema sp.]|jgi:hypothetical protein|nr:hypothetical protein [Treponema sp.]
MNWLDFIHGFGLCASIVVALSLAMRNIRNLRLLNLAGSLAFAVYGYCIKSYPVIALNLFTAGVNAVYLIKFQWNFNRRPAFDILFVDPLEDPYVQRFLRFYGEDISRFFPSFNPEELDGVKGCFILRETLPVSLVLFRRDIGDEFAILLDYAIPAFRDFKNARFFFSTAAAHIASPGMFFSAVGEVPAHTAYLHRMGFDEVGRRLDGAILFQKKV